MMICEETLCTDIIQNHSSNEFIQRISYQYCQYILYQAAIETYSIWKTQIDIFKH